MQIHAQASELLSVASRRLLTMTCMQGVYGPNQPARADAEQMSLGRKRALPVEAHTWLPVPAQGGSTRTAHTSGKGHAGPSQWSNKPGFHAALLVRA